MIAHIAVVAKPEYLAKSFETVKSLIDSQLKLGFPILTFYLKADEYSSEWTNFFKGLDVVKINQNQVKLSVFGKWYDLDSSLVEILKKLQSDTKDYDKFFLNFCINYSGQEEILDACKLTAKLVKNDKLDPDAIKMQDLKDNIYSSFLPPNIILTFTGKTEGLLLWDSVNSNIVAEKKKFEDFSKDDFEKIVKA